MRYHMHGVKWDIYTGVCVSKVPVFYLLYIRQFGLRFTYKSYSAQCTLWPEMYIHSSI